MQDQVAGGASSQENGVQQGKENQTTENSDASDQEAKTVSHETYSRAIDEVKRLKEKLREQEKLDKERKLKEAQDQGKWQEIAQAAKEEAERALKERDDLRVTYGANTVKSQLRDLLTTEGCTDVDEVIQLTDWANKISVDQETFSVNKDDVKKAVEDWKKKKPTWFKTQKTNVQHVNVTQKPVVGGSEKKSLTDLAIMLAKNIK